MQACKQQAKVASKVLAVGLTVQIGRSDGESSEDEDRQPTPGWAAAAKVRNDLLGQQRLDPDELFQQHEKTCPLDEIFASLHAGVYPKATDEDLKGLSQMQSISSDLISCNKTPIPKLLAQHMEARASFLTLASLAYLLCHLYRMSVQPGIDIVASIFPRNKSPCLVHILFDDSTSTSSLSCTSRQKLQLWISLQLKGLQEIFPGALAQEIGWRTGLPGRRR